MSHTNEKTVQSQHRPKHFVATETEKEILAKKAEEAGLDYIAKIIRSSTTYPYIALENMLTSSIQIKQS